jgi:hypothetical protein
MAAVVEFIPKAGVEAKTNVQDFVAAWKVALSGSVDWEATAWDLTGNTIKTGRARSRAGISFSTLDATSVKQKAPLSQPFLDFAKAYVSHMRGFAPTSEYHSALTALRALEKALVHATGRSDIEATNATVCNVAANFLREKLSRPTAYGTGRHLRMLADFLSEKRMVAAPFQWRNPLPKGVPLNRVGQEADERRAKKMPSEGALDALPKCFLMAVERRDVVVTSIAALLCTAPDRISEVFSLPVDCEVEQEYRGSLAYGLRWWPEKGAAPMVKWIAPTMVDVAKAAVAKLKAACAPAREVAAWYRVNPGRMFLAANLEHLRGKDDLTSDDVEDILGMARDSVTRWCRANGVALRARPNHSNYNLMRFADVERAVLAMLPRDFPVICRRTGLHYDEALVVLRPYDADPKRRPFRPMVAPVATGAVNAALGAKPNSSVFARFGFTEPDGTPIVVTTHQFRHWLNTLAQRGGLSQLDIAKWSGRKNLRQNGDYDHMTGDELVAMARGMTDGERLFGPLAELAAKAPVSRDEFLALEFPTAHVTEIGFCVHDYTMLPCQLHRDCVSCNEHVCVKGDQEKTRRIRHKLEVAEGQLRRAEEAKADGYFGADRWHDHHVATVRRLRKLVAILDDPSVPEGSLIRLTDQTEFSAIAMALDERKRLTGEDLFAPSALLSGGI